MPEHSSLTSGDDKQGDSSAADSPESKAENDAISPEVEETLKKVVEEGGPKALLSFVGAFSRTTLGPDPQTAKILADVEKHAEELRLKGYEATLEQRNKQQERDHKFRQKQLNHATAMASVVLGVAVCGIFAGLYLCITGRTELGGYILIASVMTLLQAAGLRAPTIRSGD